MMKAWLHRNGTAKIFLPNDARCYQEAEIASFFLARNHKMHQAVTFIYAHLQMYEKETKSSTAIADCVMKMKFVPLGKHGLEL